jgi:predicted RND superfamily exporter protein
MSRSPGRLERAMAALLARRRAVLTLFAAGFAVLAAGAVRLETDNSPEVYFLAGSPEVARYRAHLERFGPDEGFRVVVEGPALWTADGLARLEAIERAAAALADVRSASSLVAHHRPNLAAFPPPPEAMAAFRDRVVADRLDRAMGWVSEDGRAASVLVEARALEPRAVARLARELERLGREIAGPPSAGLAVTVAGTRTLELALDDSSLEIARVFFPLLVLFAVGLLAATFRDASGVLVPLAFVGLCQGAVLGAMGWSGVRLSLVLAVLPPVLFVIALATAIHVLIPCRALEARGLDPGAAVVAVYREKRRALAYTGVSTALGFAALAVSPVGAVRTLGVWAALGLAFQLVAAFTFYPALVAAVAARRALPERRLEARLERLGRRAATASARRRRPLLALYAILAIAAAVGLARLERESDALRYLAADHPARRAIEHVEGLGLGVASVEIGLAAPPDAPGHWRTPTGLAALSELAAALDERPEVLSAVGPGELVDDVAAASPFADLLAPEQLRAGALELIESQPELARALARFVTEDGEAARVALFVRHAGYAPIDALAGAAETEAARRLPTGTAVHSTGALLVLLALHRELLGTLAASSALTVPVLALAFWLLLRRVPDALRALAPNLWPVLVLVGGMGWLGVPLDIATVMVASVVLGLVVDDTIHTLARYRERRLEVGGFEAVADKLEHTAPAYLLTGTILAAGFGVCGFSDFAPVARFGALSAAAVVIAVITDLVLVPALFARD